jgi:hypothetical protein
LSNHSAFSVLELANDAGYDDRWSRLIFKTLPATPAGTAARSFKSKTLPNRQRYRAPVTG